MEVRTILGYAITTELQQIVAKERIADLAASYRASQIPRSSRDDDQAPSAARDDTQSPARVPVCQTGT
jgi:hypothetical protein